VATWEDVRRIALALPETEEVESRGNVAWRVGGRHFVWERPLRKPDLAALGDAAPDGPILGAMVEDLGEKAALLEAEPDVFFTTPHFEGYAAVLVPLEKITVDRLEPVVVLAFLARAPARLAQSYVKDHLD
jgi:hypothetical protein